MKQILFALLLFCITNGSHAQSSNKKVKNKFTPPVIKKIDSVPIPPLTTQFTPPVIVKDEKQQFTPPVIKKTKNIKSHKKRNHAP